ncbi:Nicotinate-nucleotide adenylyltransferase [bacterium HR39]|nr:Nicotinate-nucleotide adenylyltransferase [bacterium HR39]
MSALSRPRRRARGRLWLAEPQPLPEPAPRPLRVGLLGGSFNPAHEGHLYVSREALRRLGLDRVWWIVSPQNPLKSPEELAPFEKRLMWARRVAAAEPRIVVSDIEVRLGTRYTVDTLRRLVADRRYRFVLIIGADNLAQFHRWRHWQRIFAMVPVAVFERAPYSYSALAGQAAHRFSGARVGEREARRLAELDPPRWVFVRLRPHPASATAIRERLRRMGRDWSREFEP